jgi:hypothetical protein
VARTFNVTVGPSEGGSQEFPDASNTGVPAGTSLTAYSGPSSITTNGTTVDSKTITACINIDANNVTFTKCLFQSAGCFWNLINAWDAGTNLLIEDCEFDGLNNASADACINVANATVRRCNFHGTPDGVKLVSNSVLFEDNYIHDLVFFEDSHNDGSQTLDTIGLTIRHNTIILPVEATSCIILSTGSGTDMRNVLIEDNLLGGGNLCVYGGYREGVDDIEKVENIVIQNNWITTQIVSTGGGSGVFTSVDPPVVLSNNRWYDGPNAGQLVT